MRKSNQITGFRDYKSEVLTQKAIKYFKDDSNVDITSDTHSHHVSHRRQWFFHLMNELLVVPQRENFEAIAGRVNRDRSGVYHGVRQVQNMLETDPVKSQEYLKFRKHMLSDYATEETVDTKISEMNTKLREMQSERDILRSKNYELNNKILNLETKLDVKTQEYRDLNKKFNDFWNQFKKTKGINI